MKKYKILIVEDDEIASYLMSDFLINCSFDVDCVYTVTDGISHLKNQKYDLLLLDLNLPDFTGFELISSIKNKVAIPIIVTSAYNDTDTKVKSFKFGAHDYLTKPIDFLELEARIWSLLSRNDNIQLQEEHSVEVFTIEQRQIQFQNKYLDLTNLEFEILSLLIENKNKVISRETLTDSLSSISSNRSLDNHIKNIRKKIEQDTSNPQYLKTVYGMGYKLVI
ncbi:response regulator transcription factor [Arcobacteraceae bacterium]|nr:response regulator transcription factor [Arcobacteraceae bacterium]